ncbi:RDD family protein [Methylobacterium sp. 17Sr1-1]|uniref:RDD family protein n=1 Tax=Methylobacterium sp. 17Sr1-1 TaxID=2202826 RepID=UPI000D6EFD57|nr:RDD family protein [Methylobacterium sp. 17Sr1-1]AWN53973.1 RDD family protein [Methylobacterium sp. 17Sr1-1]
MANSWQNGPYQGGPYQSGYGGPLPPSGPGWAGPPVLVAHGSLSRRFIAYLLDILFIFGFSCLLWLAISLLGVITFGVGWALYAILPASGILYSAITVGGPRQSTLGMRMMGLRAVRATTGGPIDWITAGVHALLFYVALSTFLLWVLDIGIGVVRADRRMGHDLVLDLAVVREA